LGGFSDEARPKHFLPIWVKGEIVMKRVLALIFFAVNLLASEVQETRITGYQSGEFAVKGAVEEQVNILISRLPKNSKLEITVIGFADRIGTSAVNDRLAKDRAEEVKSVLSDKFPEAKIIALTKGDELDVKMVLVQWKVIPAPKTAVVKAEQQKNDKTWLLIYGVAGIVVTGICILSLLSRRTVRNQPAKPAEPKKLPVRWVDVEADGKIYSVPVSFESDEMWHTPLPQMNDFSKKLFRKDFADAATVIKGCVRDHRIGFYRGVFEQLAKEGKIKVKEKRNEKGA